MSKSHSSSSVTTSLQQPLPLMSLTSLQVLTRHLLLLLLLAAAAAAAEDVVHDWKNTK